MPQISNRGEIMPKSPIRKLVPLANEAKKRGIKVYHLNIGQPDIHTPEEGLNAVRNISRKILEYSPSEGYLSLREKLVEYYSRFNIEVTADDIGTEFYHNLRNVLELDNLYLETKNKYDVLYKEMNIEKNTHANRIIITILTISLIITTLNFMALMGFI